MPKLWRIIATVLRRILISIGAMYAFATLTPVDRYWTNLLTGPVFDPKGDILIILGAEAFSDVIGFESYWRAVYAVRYWRDGGYREIFISGGPGQNRMPAAIPMRDFIVAEGVPASAIRLDTTSLTTRENALHTAAALKNEPGRKVLLTSDFHSVRAYRAFRKAGLDVISSSFPNYYKLMNNWGNRWGVFVGLCQETAKIVYYFARGWI